MNTPATNSTAPAKPRKAPVRLVPSAAGSFIMRLLLGLSGAGLVAGFFMRWMTLGDMVAVSGFSLMVTEGEAVDMLSGNNRLLLFVVPLFGAVLMAGALTGHRMVLWAALVFGLIVLGFGFYTAIRLFLQTTGLGMWLVIVCSFFAFGLALIGLARNRR